MGGRETRKRPEVSLTEEERFRLSEARATVALLSEREPPSDAMTEVGYEQRQCRAEALRSAVEFLKTDPDSCVDDVIRMATRNYRFMWFGQEYGDAAMEG